jgi:hypothetical protein
MRISAMKPRARAIAAGIGAVLGCMALCLPAAAGAASLSDSFAGRDGVAGLPTEVTGSNVGAGREMGEPVLKPLSPAGHSVWLEWEATSTGYVTLSTCGSAIPTVLGVYTGSELDKLSEVASAAQFGGPGCPGIGNGVTFLASTGAKFQIALDGNGFFVPPALPPVTEGPLALRIEATPPPVNDDFQGATALEGTISEEPGGARRYFADRFGYNWGATKQAGESDHAGDQGGASVWYSWTAPETGSAQVGVCCGPFSLGVYRGGAVGSLTEVKPSAFGTIPVFAGDTYRLAVDGKYELVADAARVGSFDLTVSMELPPSDPLSPTDPPPGAGLASGAAVVPANPDAAPPRTVLDSRRVRSRARSAVFGFHADETGSAFRCVLDARKASPCRSPKGYSGLSPGQHVFKVYAVDPAGNADLTPATARFAIRLPPGKPSPSGGG